MPTLTLTLEALALLGVVPPDLIPMFTPEGRGPLDAYLTSLGFDITPAVHVVALRREGFVFTQ
jgi:hypothetical protein